MRMFALVFAVACSRAATPVAAPHPTPRPPPRGPAIIATDQHDPDDLVVDAENVYWTAGDGIWRAPLGEGAAQQVAGPLGGDILAMAGDATTLYVTLDGSGYHTLPKGRGKLVAIAKTGGTTRTLAEDLTWAPAIAVDEHDVFVGNTFDSISFGAETGQVRAYPKAGGAARMLATTETAPAAIAVDGDAVYWANYGGANEVRRVDKRGGTVALLAKELGTRRRSS